MAMKPLAPGLLSMTSCCPQLRDKRSLRMRITASGPLPGEYGATERTGLEGKVCATAWGTLAAATRASAQSARAGLKICERMAVSMGVSPWFYESRIRLVSDGSNSDLHTVAVQRLKNRRVAEAEQVERASGRCLGRERLPRRHHKQVAPRHLPGAFTHRDGAAAVKHLEHGRPHLTLNPRCTARTHAMHFGPHRGQHIGAGGG